MKGVFVTGTDSGVGKTVVSAMLTMGLMGEYWKPVQTGAARGRDSDLVGRLVGWHRVLPETYCFRSTLLPHHAARQEKTLIELSSFKLPKSGRPVIAEGTGGVFTPLNESLLMVDLIRYLGLPALVVAKNSLGCVNQTLMTLRTLKEHSVNVLGVVLVGEPNFNCREAIEQFSSSWVLAEMPWVDPLAPDELTSLFQQLFASKFDFSSNLLELM